MLTEVQIYKIIADTLDRPDWVTPDKNAVFEDLGLDSLDRFAILVALQEASGVEVPDDDVDDLQSVAAIEAYFSAR